MDQWPPKQDFTFNEVYPERDGKPSKTSIGLNADRTETIGNCQKSVIKCFENVPYLKLLWNSLESQGCKPDLSRHISCELCQGGNNIEHAGNFDHKTNQVCCILLFKL